MSHLAPHPQSRRQRGPDKYRPHQEASGSSLGWAAQPQGSRGPDPMTCVLQAPPAALATGFITITCYAGLVDIPLHSKKAPFVQLRIPNHKGECTEQTNRPEADRTFQNSWPGEASLLLSSVVCATFHSLQNDFLLFFGFHREIFPRKV